MKVFLQKDLKDCGLAVLQSIYHFFYDKKLSINSLKTKAFYSNDGINIANLERLAKEFGIILESYGGPYENLKTLEIVKPTIILIKTGDLNHYVLLTKVKKSKFEIIDPLKGKVKIKAETMAKIFQNVVIFAQKDPEYKKSKIKDKSWNNWWFFLESKSNWYLIFLFFITAVSNFLSSLFMKTIIDKVLPQQDIGLVIKVSLFFAWIVIWRILQDIIKKIYIHKIELKIEKDIFDRFFNALKTGKNFQLLKLDNHDYIRRINLIPSFAAFSASFYYHIFNEVITFLISFFILLWIDIKILGLIIGIGIIYLFISIIVRKSISKNHQFLMEDQLNSLTSTNDMIFSLENLKRDDVYKHLKHQFDEKYYRYKKTEFNIWKKESYLSSFNNFLFSLAPILIVVISSFWIFDKKLSIGELLLFLSFFSFFINPLSSFVNIVTNLPIFLKEFELLNFVLNIEKETTGKYHQKISDIKLKDLSVSYYKNKTLFYIEKMQIKENLHIIGKNGSGKSTFLRLLNQEIVYNGDFLINNLDLKYYDQNELRKRICYIKSQNYFPNISVLSFITNENPEKIQNLINNFQRFDIQEMLYEWQISLDSKFVNNGSNFSSGQKQIIAILQLLTKDFDLILLDEAFENIDEKNFEFLKKVISNYQKNAMFIEISHSKRYVIEQGETFDIKDISKQ
ncbi:Mbov_0121 family peptidase domain-containing ABC transporter [Mesomycoplasma ovipneumoniae]|uniref:Cysteine peptidase family C39 domain-containing protein n=1 Tax=Mesomycoplasma ovipneumoniae TaxID=29562 RepID=A0AAJ2UF87_9BACT|nr:cysteine peptidase family C39 domain-containing protein [Mesomycoplasma ovipneumoniae]MDW2907086.1 cysteine peptidase family C39 domain-containing protein [Mesomycoplasma ovipneumoniae]MDW2909396.1 cysteine peptidase family C39 domain-containing protein [Mesomycoplasma ovipneumoniae]MDW2909833.1 cysteine peptidase family C39 domain-containing protein [Mesomycoplasma ovipneumoniae]MDW2911348.1 cysteine peptidase family C39 domain-containing protein [Mesomycoplasma ovipneumoniae]MDW2912219.1 